MPEIGQYGARLWDGSKYVELRPDSGTNRNLRVQLYNAGSAGVVTNIAADAGVASGYPNTFGAVPFLFNGVSLDRARVVSTRKTYYLADLATNTTGDVWTPGSGKKFRLRGVTISGDFANGDQIELLDEGTVIGNWVYGDEPVREEMEANGYLSAAADNDLKVRHQKGAAAKIAVNAWGSEE